MGDDSAGGGLETGLGESRFTNESQFRGQVLTKP